MDDSDSDSLQNCLPFLIFSIDKKSIDCNTSSINVFSKLYVSLPITFTVKFVKIVQNQKWGGRKCLEIKEVKVHVIEEGKNKLNFSSQLV